MADPLNDQHVGEGLQHDCGVTLVSGNKLGCRVVRHLEGRQKTSATSHRHAPTEH